MDGPSMTEIYTDLMGARELLSQQFEGAIFDQDHKCVSGGFVITEAANEKVRVYHRLPVPDYDADEYPTSDELAAERHRMNMEYATAFIDAGWYVLTRGEWSEYPHLLASRRAWIHN